MTRDEIRVRLTDEQALVCTLYGECRGEPLLGQVAVACVIRNRVRQPAMPRTYRDICLAPFQFSCWNSGSEQADVATTYALAAAIVQGQAPPLASGDACALRQLEWIGAGIESGVLMDVTDGATFYLTTALYLTSPPKWAAHMTVTARLGRQTFLRSGPAAGAAEVSS